MKNILDKILYYAGKKPYVLLIPSIILSEIVTLMISVPMSYMLFGGMDKNIYIALTCGFLVSFVVCGILVYYARYSIEMKNEIEKLKRALNLNEDGTYVFRLSISDFKNRLTEEMERGSRHGFSMIIMKIEVKNFDVLKEIYGEDHTKNLLKDLNELLNGIKRSYDLLTSENVIYTVLLNQVVNNSVEQVCKRFFNTIVNHKFSVRKFENMITSNAVKLKISLAGLEFSPSKDTTPEIIFEKIDKLLSDTDIDTYQFKTGL